MDIKVELIRQTNIFEKTINQAIIKAGKVARIRRWSLYKQRKNQD